jgi:RNA polymerase sigma factor (sigma-70 family)
MSPLDLEVRRLCAAGELDAAATAAIEGLGPELLGFLVVLAGDPNDAGEIFADVCVRLWTSLSGFRWESSLRTWAYVVARRAAAAHRRSRDAWRARHVPVSQVPEVEALVIRIRTTAIAAEKRQTRAERLRARLAPDEQALLTLRIDRELEWRDIAQVLADEDLDDAELTRAAAGLRKKFERLKERLRKMAAEEG